MFSVILSLSLIECVTSKLQDSCFWLLVSEAKISTQALKSQKERKRPFNISDFMNKNRKSVQKFS